MKCTMVLLKLNGSLLLCATLLSTGVFCKNFMSILTVVETIMNYNHIFVFVLTQNRTTRIKEIIRYGSSTSK